jgi:hypothetical protein
MLVAGLALGLLIGPAPASSLASGARAAALARVVAMLALSQGANAAGQILPAPTVHAHASAPQAAPAGAGKTAGSNQSATSAGQSETGSATSSPTHSPSSNGLSPTKSHGTSGGSEESKPARLPPIAHVWLIVLPFGQSFTSLLAAPASAPYLTGQLVGQGTLLGTYSALATNALANTAALLSGQEASAVSTIAPACASAADGTPGATATAPATGTPPAISGAPCATSEPAAAQAADTFLREVIPPIVASAEYREHGLIAITFADAGVSTSAAPAAGSTTTPAIAYPAGTSSSMLTVAGAPGALLLSPFLRHPGARLRSTFDQLAPRQSLEELVKPGS